MEKISEWIDGVIEDLVSNDKRLNDILLKVKVLAFRLKNERLKKWVDYELDGYKTQDVPEFRIIPCSVHGNLIQTNFGGYATRNNCVLPIEQLDEDLQKELRRIKVTSSVSEIESMINDGNTFRININVYLQSEITEILANGWEVDSAWKLMPINSLEKILGSIKSHLLSFLLELNQEIGDDENYSVLDNKREVDDLVQKTIGNITGETINLQLGDSNTKTVITGNDNTMNIAQGQGITQNISNGLKKEIEEISNLINSKIEELGLDDENKEDVLIELGRIKAQLNREKPKVHVLFSALNLIKGILTGIAANAYTPIVIEKLSLLLSSLGKFLP